MCLLKWEKVPNISETISWCSYLLMFQDTDKLWNVYGEHFSLSHSFFFFKGKSQKVNVMCSTGCLRSAPIVMVMHFLQTMRAQCFLTQLDNIAGNLASRRQWHLKSQSSFLKELNPDVAPSVNGQNSLFFSGI